MNDMDVPVLGIVDVPVSKRLILRERLGMYYQQAIAFGAGAVCAFSVREPILDGVALVYTVIVVWNLVRLRRLRKQLREI